MNAPYLSIGDRFRITDPKQRTADKSIRYVVVKADENGDLICHDENEDRYENKTIFCINRIPFEAIYGRGHIKIVDEKAHIEAVEAALAFLPEGSPIPMDLGINGMHFEGAKQ